LALARQHLCAKFPFVKKYPNDPWPCVALESFAQPLRHPLDKHAQNRAASPQLARELELVHAGAVVVATIIGHGIYLVPSEISRAFGCSTFVHNAGGRHWSEYLL
jgi:hypothetical protein